MFHVSTLDPENPPRKEDGTIDWEQDFFGKFTALTVSGQLEGELGATSLGKIYTFGPTFRAENSNTPRHLAEFWMIEPEMAFYQLDELTALEEEFIKYCVKWALDHCMDDLEFLNKMIDNGLIERLKSVIDTDFVRLPYTEGIKILEEAVKNGVKFEFPVSWGVDLASEHERYLVEKHFKKPVIMIDYPKEIKAFYMKQNDDGRTVQGTDVLFPQIGEIIGGSVREENYDKLMTRINELNIPMKDMWWYLDTRRYGSCPHAGFGLILMALPEIERHPLRPFLPEGARLLMLGSFPPPRKRWCMDFFYPNRSNMMWEIFGLVFFGDSRRLVDAEHKTFRMEDIKALLEERGIAIYDTACAVRRLSGNASDKDLEVVDKTDIPLLLSKIPHCHDIVCTGQKSFSVLTDDYGVPVPQMGFYNEFTLAGRPMRLWRMPSSSRAYPMKLEEKASYYREMMVRIGII